MHFLKVKVNQNSYVTNKAENEFKFYFYLLPNQKINKQTNKQTNKKYTDQYLDSIYGPGHIFTMKVSTKASQKFCNILITWDPIRLLQILLLRL